MNSPRTHDGAGRGLPDDARLLELLADEALVGLTEGERAELETLLRLHGPIDREGLERAAAAVDVAHADRDGESLPRSLRDRLEAEGRRAIVGGAGASAGSGAARVPVLRLVGDDEAEQASVRPRRMSAVGWLGWVAAAASLALAVYAFNRPGPPGGVVETLTAAQQRTRLLAEAPDAVVAPWSDWELGGEAPEITGVQGDVVWSESRQEGYMRFVGLPANDPRVQQYQLWIVDERGLADASGQSARISGGVFDAGNGEIIIPIQPRLATRKAGLFALTIEKPGGSWVSDMTRRVVAAALPAVKPAPGG